MEKKTPGFCCPSEEEVKSVLSRWIKRVVRYFHWLLFHLKWPYWVNCLSLPFTIARPVKAWLGKGILSELGGILGFRVQNNKSCNITFPAVEKKNSLFVVMAKWEMRYLPESGCLTPKQTLIISFYAFPGWITILLNTQLYLIISHTIFHLRVQLLAS